MKWGFILVTLYTGPLVMMGRDMRAMVPSELLFWGVMSLGVIAGFAVAYPANVWLVAHHLKHGLMTERSPHGTSPSPSPHHAPRYAADTINVGPGQRFDVIWSARNAGRWPVHCHIGHHTTNNNVEMQEGGGLMMIINVTG